jgi:hypothetical protein
MTAVPTPGNYLARVVHQYFGESKKKGTLKFALGIQIFQDLDNDSLCMQFEREIYWWITEKSLPWVMYDLRVLGYQGQTLSDLDPDTTGFHNFHGLELEVSCNYEKCLDGEVRERWKLTARRENLRDKSRLRQFDRILGGTNGRATGGGPANLNEDASLSEKR